MTVFRLSQALIFPPPAYADPDGLLAVGGDLSPARLLLAYRMGIFPWYSEGTPILWWSPDPRLVLLPDEFRISKSLKRVIKKGIFRVTADRAFPKVIEECGAVRTERGEETWIVPEMLEAYCELHRLGFAHSVESWFEGELVGGLYGVAMGRVFFGESMFMRKTDASKVALAGLVKHLRRWNYRLLDCQVTTPHLKSFGARELPRSEFLDRLEPELEHPTKPGRWSFNED